MFLSLIIPTRDRPRDTLRAIGSVLGQGVEGCEIIVVDDKSREIAPELLELERDGKITLIRHEQNRGAAAARNSGLRAASGRFISFLDSDDYLLSRSLAQRGALAEAALDQSGGKPMVFACGFVNVSPEGQAVRARQPRGASTPEQFASGCWYCPGSAILMLRETAMALGQQDEHMRRLEDMDWFLRFALAGGTLVPQDILGVAITVGHHPSYEATVASVAYFETKWLSGPNELSAAARRRLRAYSALEKGATAIWGGRIVTGLCYLAASFALVPRLSLHLSPGWIKIRGSLPAK